MKRLLSIFIAVCLFGVSAHPVTPAFKPRDINKGISPYTMVAAQTYSTVVRIDVFKESKLYYVNSKGQNVLEKTVKSHFLGSGVFINPSGYILTCGHLFKDHYSDIMVTYFDESGMAHTVPAFFDVADYNKDLALVHIRDTGDEPHMYAGFTGIVGVGEEVLAIGHPLGLEWTVTRGIVSCARRNDGKAELIQFDASVNPGNSGGPLFDMDGNIVGIIVSLLNAGGVPASAGLNFAVSFRECLTFLNLHRDLINPQINAA